MASTGTGGTHLGRGYVDGWAPFSPLHLPCELSLFEDGLRGTSGKVDGIEGGTGGPVLGGYFGSGFKGGLGGVDFSTPYMCLPVRYLVG